MDSIVHPCTRCKYPLQFTGSCLVTNCPACGSVNARPSSTGAALEKLQRAADLRLACEFPEAEQAYQAILQQNPDDHEALWGRLLCHYGVEFVEDSATGRRLPMVHTVRAKPMQEQPDFRLACEHAPDEVRSQYRQDAAYIDEAQSAIHRLAASMKPYDVFLCHKTTKPGSSEKTEDFTRALQLYHFLEKNGVRTFFAPECLQSAAGANYEAGIYHALSTARTMLVICSDEEYLNSTWVRSEWSRFLEMADGQEGKRLIPLLYDHFSASALPAPFRMRSLQGMDMSRISAAQTLLGVLQGQPGDAPPMDTEYHVNIAFPNLRRSWKTVPGWKVFSSDRETILGGAAWDKTVRIPLPAEHDVLWIGPADAPRRMAELQKRRKRLVKLMLITAVAGIASLLLLQAYLFLIAAFVLAVMGVLLFVSLRRIRSCYTCTFQAAAGKRYRLTWQREAVSDRLKCTPE